MATPPQPPPEAALITARIERMAPRPSRSELARQAGISPALWAKIEKGYDQPARGLRVPYKGSAKAVAAMCAVVLVTPEELRAAGRDDAARILEAIPDTAAPEPTAEDWQSMLKRLDRMEQMLAEVLGPAGGTPGDRSGTRRAV